MGLKRHPGRSNSKAELDEGPMAFERFREAVKKIISAPKIAIDQKERPKKKSRTRRPKAALSHG